MNSPLVSIIIPTYNRKNFLDISISSVLRQTFTNWELIIVDDFSDDGTYDFLKKTYLKDKRIRYIRNYRHKGVAGARNSGILVSRAKYISFLDSDDEWLPFHLENLIYYLERYPDKIDIISAAQVLVDFKTKKRIKCSNLEEYLKYPGYFLEKAYLFEGDIFDLALKMFLVTNCAMLAKREVFDKVLYPEDIRMNEDSFFVLSVAYYGFKIAFLPEIHLLYYLHEHNTSNVSGNRSPEKNIILAKEQIKFYKKCLKNFVLRSHQRKIILKKLSDCYCWHLGYNGYLLLGDRKTFLSFFKEGLNLDFINLKKWKTYIKYLLLDLMLSFLRNCKRQ